MVERPDRLITGLALTFASSLLEQYNRENVPDQDSIILVGTVLNQLPPLFTYCDSKEDNFRGFFRKLDAWLSAGPSATDRLSFSDAVCYTYGSAISSGSLYAALRLVHTQAGLTLELSTAASGRAAVLLQAIADETPNSTFGESAASAEAQAAPMTWECELCTATNSMKNENCDVCMCPRDQQEAKSPSAAAAVSPTPAPAAAAAPTEWACGVCTFLNPLSATNCEMCSSEAPPGARSPPPPPPPPQPAATAKPSSRPPPPRHQTTTTTATDKDDGSGGERKRAASMHAPLRERSDVTDDVTEGRRLLAAVGGGTTHGHAATAVLRALARLANERMEAAPQSAMLHEPFVVQLDVDTFPTLVATLKTFASASPPGGEEVCALLTLASLQVQRLMAASKLSPVPSAVGPATASLPALQACLEELKPLSGDIRSRCRAILSLILKAGGIPGIAATLARDRRGDTVADCCAELLRLLREGGAGGAGGMSVTTVADSGVVHSLAAAVAETAAAGTLPPPLLEVTLALVQVATGDVAALHSLSPLLQSIVAALSLPLPVAATHLILRTLLTAAAVTDSVVSSFLHRTPAVAPLPAPAQFVLQLFVAGDGIVNLNRLLYPVPTEADLHTAGASLMLAFTYQQEELAVPLVAAGALAVAVNAMRLTTHDKAARCGAALLLRLLLPPQHLRYMPVDMVGHAFLLFSPSLAVRRQVVALLTAAWRVEAMRAQLLASNVLLSVGATLAAASALTSPPDGDDATAAASSADRRRSVSERSGSRPASKGKEKGARGQRSVSAHPGKASGGNDASAAAAAAAAVGEGESKAAPTDGDEEKEVEGEVDYLASVVSLLAAVTAVDTTHHLHSLLPSLVPETLSLLHAQPLPPTRQQLWRDGLSLVLHGLQQAQAQADADSDSATASTSTTTSSSSATATASGLALRPTLKQLRPAALLACLDAFPDDAALCDVIMTLMLLAAQTIPNKVATLPGFTAVARAMGCFPRDVSLQHRGCRAILLMCGRKGKGYSATAREAGCEEAAQAAVAMLLAMRGEGEGGEEGAGKSEGGDGGSGGETKAAEGDGKGKGEKGEKDGGDDSSSRGDVDTDPLAAAEAAVMRIDNKCVIM